MPIFTSIPGEQDTPVTDPNEEQPSLEEYRAGAGAAVEQGFQNIAGNIFRTGEILSANYLRPHTGTNTWLSQSDAQDFAKMDGVNLQVGKDGIAGDALQYEIDHQHANQQRAEAIQKGGLSGLDQFMYQLIGDPSTYLLAGAGTAAGAGEGVIKGAVQGGVIKGAVQGGVEAAKAAVPLQAAAYGLAQYNGDDYKFSDAMAGAALGVGLGALGGAAGGILGRMRARSVALAQLADDRPVDIGQLTNAPTRGLNAAALETGEDLANRAVGTPAEPTERDQYLMQQFAQERPAPRDAEPVLARAQGVKPEVEPQEELTKLTQADIAAAHEQLTHVEGGTDQLKAAMAQVDEGKKEDEGFLQALEQGVQCARVNGGPQ